MVRIYLDVCCLNRPFDDQRQDRIRLESEAVILILTHLDSGEWECIGSEVVNWEIEKIPDPDRRARVMLLAAYGKRSIPVGKAEIIRAQKLETLKFTSFDALHIACAERGKVDVFLTTDDKLLRVASRHVDELHTRVENPLTWLRGGEKI